MPGTYKLEAIQSATDGNVLDSDGRPYRLAQFTTGKITLLSFIYTYCSDPVGCPLAYETFIEVHDKVVADPALKGRVRFASLSFDPANDSPQAMKVYGGKFAQRDAPLPWHFLTTRGYKELVPILDSYGQDVSIDLDASGKPTRTLSHMLKVFLIDRRGVVREIYTTAFLLPQVLLNDIKTLVLEENKKGR